MKRALVLFLFLVLGAGCESVKATVNCKTVEGPAVECDIAETQGKSEVEVCWDFKVVCNNGATIVPPRSCAKVKDGGKTHYTIGADKLAGADKCDGGPKATISNLTLNGQPSQL